MQVNLFWAFLLPIIAGSTMVFVVYLVMHEKHEHEEYYVPPQPGPRTERPADPDAMMTAEITGTPTVERLADHRRRAEAPRRRRTGITVHNLTHL